jgi:hypothetical protein
MAVYTIGSDGNVIEIDATEKLKSLSKSNISDQLPIEDKKDSDWTLSSATNSSKITKVQENSITNNTHGNTIDTGGNNIYQVAYKNYNSPFGDQNDLSKSDNFAARYQLDGLQGLNTFNALNEGDIANTADFVILYFNLISRMLILNSTLNVVLNVSTRIPENAKNFLGSYKNKNVDYVAKYLSERYNYPVDLYKKESNFFDLNLFSNSKFEDKKSTIMTTNVAFLLGLNEFLFPGNGLSKDLDNYIQNNVVPPNLEESNFYNFFNALATAGIEYLSAEEDSKNRIKLLMRKLEMSYDFNHSLNEMEKNNFDPVVKFLFENVFDNYAFKFLIERINVGLRFMNKKHEDAEVKNIFLPKIVSQYDRTSSGKIDDSKELKLNLNSSNDNGISYTSIQNTSSALLLHKSARVYGSRYYDMFDKKFIPSDYNRLSSDTVEKIEQIIDSDYMPFSIHDLRTNEVIGLNAFIESYSDSFSAQYNETGGFGRVDKVMKWESTSRSISITFYMIATNRDDHDMMWYQINKMVSMLYPQWSAPSGVVYYSEGTKYREKDIGGYEAFRYPFTQVPTASPLVRIRLGDILTNNYSRVNIKRIHGYGDRSKLQSVDNQNFDTDIQISLEEHKKNDVDETNRLNLQEGYYDIKDNNLIYDKIKITPDNKAIIFPLNGNLPKVECKYSLTIYDYKNTLKDQKEIEVGILFFNDGDKNVLGDFKFISSLTKIKPTQLKEVTADINIVPLDLEGISGEKLNNPITAGFATTMGKGLAGMISSFSVDFSAELPWEIDRGSRAPIYTKITMQFKPIHDIAPGLDHNGMMRAPVYRVGNTVRSLN